MSVYQKLELLKGMLDENHPLHLLDRNYLVWNKIWNEIEAWYRLHIQESESAYEIMENFWNPNVPAFPEPTNIDVNMMPIKMFDLKGSLPDWLWGYKHMIEACYVPGWDYDRNDTSKYWQDKDKIVYLTIQESWISAGESQRRPGLHIERPLMLRKGGESLKNPCPFNRYSYYQCLRWGMGKWKVSRAINGNIPLGGIYMSTNLEDSCEVYGTLINNPIGFIDRHGGIEHARYRLSSGRKLRKNELCWITDETPHESLPVKADISSGSNQVQRSFFRLVVGEVSVWYSKHNTPNPLGVQPDCPVIDDDKFAVEDDDAVKSTR